MSQISAVNVHFNQQRFASRGARYDEMVAAGIHPDDSGWTEYIVARRVDDNSFMKVIRGIGQIQKRFDRNNALVKLWESATLPENANFAGIKVLGAAPSSSAGWDKVNDMRKAQTAMAEF